MSEVLAVAEHRRGELREITLEVIGKGSELAQAANASLSTVLIGSGVDELAQDLSKYTQKVLLVETPTLKEVNTEVHQLILAELIRERNPVLVLTGHTSYAYDLAPSLSTELGAPLLTDCIDLAFEDSTLVGTRQMYGGKLNARVTCANSPIYMATLRQGSFQPPPQVSGQIEKITTSVVQEPDYRRFIQYVEEALGDVDITKADVVIGIGRGIKEEQNMGLVQQLADALGGVLACSRPVVDAGWLSKDRQVGSSGKTVKPKLYVAVGISGAFQHVTGMKASETIVAINKDPNAPIFADAHYGIVDDLFKVVPALTEKIAEMKSGGKA